MIRILSSLLFALSALGQGAQISLSPSPNLAPAGATVVLTVTLATGGGPSALNWDMTGVPIGATATSLVTGKQVQCNGTTTVAPTRCLLFPSPPAATAIADGPIATISYVQPSTPPTEALATPVSASPAAMVITTTVGASTNRCDVTGDGKIDGADVIAIVNQVLGRTASSIDVMMVILAGLGGACLR